MPDGVKLKATTNAIGDFGEDLTRTSFSRPVRGLYRRPLFRASPLGGKYPIVDFIVDVLDVNDRSLGFFFVQVKSTSTAKPKSKRLKIDVDLAKFNQLAGTPAPTFFIGVDVMTEKVFLVTAAKLRKRAFYSICKSFDLSDETVRIGLYKEVVEYWRKTKHKLNKPKTRFSE